MEEVSPTSYRTQSMVDAQLGRLSSDTLRLAQAQSQDHAEFTQYSKDNDKRVSAIERSNAILLTILIAEGFVFSLGIIGSLVLNIILLQR